MKERQDKAEERGVPLYGHGRKAAKSQRPFWPSIAGQDVLFCSQLKVPTVVDNWEVAG